MRYFLTRVFALLAIPSILRVLASFQLVLFVLLKFMNPEQAMMLRMKLLLDFDMVFEGEVWRLVTFVLLPLGRASTSTGFFFLIFAVLFLFLINDILEQAWGKDGLTAYFFTGLIGAILGTLILWFVFPFLATVASLLLAEMFALSFLLAAGTIASRVEIRLFFVLPVSLGFVALLAGVIYLFNTLEVIVKQPIMGLAWLVCLVNYGIWCLPTLVREVRLKKGNWARRRKFEAAKPNVGDAFHTCVECGATETSHPEREFRVTADGDEHCDDCLARKRGS